MASLWRFRYIFFLTPSKFFLKDFLFCFVCLTHPNVILSLLELCFYMLASFTAPQIVLLQGWSWLFQEDSTHPFSGGSGKAVPLKIWWQSGLSFYSLHPHHPCFYTFNHSPTCKRNIYCWDPKFPSVGYKGFWAHLFWDIAQKIL